MWAETLEPFGLRTIAQMFLIFSSRLVCDGRDSGSLSNCYLVLFFFFTMIKLQMQSFYVVGLPGTTLGGNVRTVRTSTSISRPRSLYFYAQSGTSLPNYSAVIYKPTKLTALYCIPGFRSGLWWLYPSLAYEMRGKSIRIAIPT